MAREIELKLDVERDKAGLIDAWLGEKGDVRTRKLVSVYYDTPAQFLAKSRMSLRVRQDGEGFVQTVKGSGAHNAGLFDRDEWEKPLSGRVPDLEDTPLAGLPPQTLDAMTPVFSIAIERRDVTITEGDTLIEVAFDSGAVVAGPRRADICEVELELKSGDPQRLFDLAETIGSVVPTRVGVDSKSARGYHLMAALPDAVKAGAIDLDATTGNAEAGFVAIASSCIVQYRRNEDILLAHPTPDAIHQARVALRRLRSAMALFESAINDKARDALLDELKWLANELGMVRDLDVLVRALGTGKGLETLGPARDDAYRQVGAILKGERVRALMLDLTRWLALGDWRSDPGTEAARTLPIADFAADTLQSVAKKLEKRGKDLAELDAEARHRVRKTAKKLRYGTEFFASLYAGKKSGKHHARYLAKLQALQESLGDLNDRANAPALQERYGLPVTPSNDADHLIETAAGQFDALMEAKRFWK